MDASTLVITGEFGIYRAAELKPQLLAHVMDLEDPALDLRDVTETDAAGLQLLLFARREAAARGKRLRLAGASPAVQEVLRVAGIEPDHWNEMPA
ncbi:MAG: STAS domain-containing protein [Betaproteobacteria bacterium]|jgi:anti-anti-sigma factor